MNKIAVLYKSKYGATKKYATMLQEELSCDIYDVADYKKIILLCVGASPFDEKTIEEVKTHNLKEDLKGIPFFYARGAWNESSMTLKDRTMCKMLQKIIAKQDTDSCELWMKELLCSQGKICDWTDKKNLLPILEYIRGE